MNGLHIACTGRLGGDPEQRFTNTGKAMLVFTVAVDENTQATEERTAPETLWLRCTAWDELATTLGATLHKGSAVYVEGRLRHGKWQGQDGSPRCGLNVSCWRVEVHGAIGKTAPKREAVAV
jgi:single-strand DNA-binding protein